MSTSNENSCNNIFSLLSPKVQEKLGGIGITEPTKVQEKVIPKVLEGKNLVFQSETGTGKTFAYLLPLVQRLEKDEDLTKLRILVVAPTFELASQINAAAKSITESCCICFFANAMIN